MATSDPAQTEDIRLISKQDVVKELSRVISNLKKNIDCYVDAKNLPVILRVLSSNDQKLKELRARGIKLRCITEVTKDNLSLCKEIMRNFELYHVSYLVGSFLIADEREYFGFLDTSGQEGILLVTNSSFVDTQQFLINTMFSNALLARQRIIEIGRGAENEFMETIRDPLRVKSLILDLIRSANYEIAILFSTKNSFLMAEREGILEEIERISKHDVKAKILVMQDEIVKEISDTKLKASNQNIQVNYLQQFLPTKITTIIVDQIKCLTVEVNDDTKETFQEAIGISTYSNSESTVFSNVSIFESLWIQAELDKQTKARQAYFKLFKGFRLKDEVYSRRWSSQKEEEGNERPEKRE